MQLGSMFICNCNNALHVSDAFCVHLQEHLEIVEAASGQWHETGWGIQQGVQGWIPQPVSCHSPEAASTISKYSWRWTQIASETCRAILQLQINILPSCITLVLLYIQSDSGGICNTLGNDSMCDSKQKSSYEHGSDFKRLPRYGKKNIWTILPARTAIT